MYHPSDLSLCGPPPEAAEERARKERLEAARTKVRSVMGREDLSQHMESVAQAVAEGPTPRRAVEGTDILPKGGYFETDREALYCQCGQLHEDHNDPFVHCSRKQEQVKADFDPLATVGFLTRAETLTRAYEQRHGEED
jgi:hypothetical protein